MRPVDVQRAANFARLAQTSPDQALALTVDMSRRDLLDMCMVLALADSSKTPMMRRRRDEITIEDGLWTDAEARQAHNSWGRGERTLLTAAGERVYQRRSKARRRAS